MKKILALVLVVSLMLLSMIGCGNKNNGAASDETVNKVAGMLAESNPTLVQAESTITIGEKQPSESTYSLKRGEINNMKVIVYESSITELLSVEEGASVLIVPPFGTKTQKIEYVEGSGVRVDGGQFDMNKTDDVFTEFEISITPATASDAKYENNTLTFKVKAADTEKVFGTAIKADVNVTIVDDGNWIKSIDISYVVPAHIAKNPDNPGVTVSVEEIVVSMSISYSYDIQNINIA